MRDIRYRGKRKDTGEWVFGYPLETKMSGAYIIGTKMRSKPHRQGVEIGDVVWQHEVYPETVDQFTGLKDINNQDIYENDILSINDAGNYVVAYAEGCFGAWDNDGFTPFRQSIWGLGGVIIGTQHDNPNLLGS